MEQLVFNYLCEHAQNWVTVSSISDHLLYRDVEDASRHNVANALASLANQHLAQSKRDSANGGYERIWALVRYKPQTRSVRPAAPPTPVVHDFEAEERKARMARRMVRERAEQQHASDLATFWDKQARKSAARKEEEDADKGKIKETVLAMFAEDVDYTTAQAVALVRVKMRYYWHSTIKECLYELEDEQMLRSYSKKQDVNHWTRVWHLRQ